MSNENLDSDTFDVVESCGADERYRIVVHYRGRAHQILADLLESTGIWIQDATAVSAVFGKEHTFYMPFAIAVLRTVLKESDAAPPVRGVDVKRISEIAHTTRGSEAIVNNFTLYYKSLIEPRPAVDAAIMPRASHRTDR